MTMLGAVMILVTGVSECDNARARPPARESGRSGNRGKPAGDSQSWRMTRFHGETLIGDGHAVIEGAARKLISLGELYDGIPVANLVLVEDTTEALLVRRADKGRSADRIAQLQLMEVRMSSEWAKKLGLSLKRVRGGNVTAFSPSIR